MAFGLVVVWAATGPIFNYSEPWQLVINTGTTIITFPMMFLFQKSQNKESIAVQLKLKEIVAANELAINRMMDVEDLTEDGLKAIRKYYSKLKNMAKNEDSLQKSHFIEEAKNRHSIKEQARRRTSKVSKTNK